MIADLVMPYIDHMRLYGITRSFLAACRRVAYILNKKIIKAAQDDVIEANRNI
jgi:hypothetical protein